MADVPKDARRSVGERGEQLAERHLAARGYRVLERNFRTPYGELDLVAQRGRFLVICEVKTRVGRPEAAFGPLVAVGAEKRRRLRRMAREWLARRAEVASQAGEIRFDAIGIRLAPDRRLLALEHLEGAF